MEILQRAIKRMQSFCVVDMPPASNIPFNIDNEKLVQVVKTKNHDILQELGGVEGITSALKSNASFGIRANAEDLCHRRNVFGSNAFRKSGVSRCLYSVLCGLKDFSVLTIATLACCVYLIIAGIRLYGRESGWEEGAYPLVFFPVYSMLDSIVELGIATYFRKVKKSGHFAVVLRNGMKQRIPFSGVLVGDIVCLKTGDKIPADGLFVDGDQSLKLDESHLKESAEIVEIDHANPFLSSGAKLIEGQAKMVVTSVGKNTICYEEKGSLYHQEVTQLKAHVDVLARHLDRAKWILAVSFLPISLARYFSGNSKDGDGNSEFNQGITTALQVSYAFVENILAVMAISIAMDTTNFSWAVKVCLAHAIDKMAAQKIVVRNLSAWEKIGLGVATINVVEGNNTLTTDQVEASKFLSVPQFVETKETPSLISPNVLELVQQGMSLNTTGIAYRAVRTRKIEFSGSPCERAILSRAALELDMDWERLSQNCTILKVEALEMEGRGVLVRKDDTIHLHMRGPADMILKRCSSFYDASGSLCFLNDDMRNLLEGKLRSIDAGGTIQVNALAHRKVGEEELTNNQDLIEKEYCYGLLGFLALKEINQGQILKKVLEECINVGVGFNLITSENPVNGAAEFIREAESNQGLKDETLAEGMMSGEDDDKSVSMGSGGEEFTENISDTATSDRKSDSAASIDQLNVAKFCLVEELTGSEALTSTSPVVLELLKQGIDPNTTENVVSCDNFSRSPIEKAILSWAIHELNLDLEELEKNISICRSVNINLENQGLGFLSSLENGTLHMHKRGPAEDILKMCSSYYCISGETKALVGHERMLLEQKVQGLESRKCHWVAFVHSQVSQDTTQDCWTLLGILILDQENPGVKDDVGCHADEVLASEAEDDGEVSEPSHDVNSATIDSTVEDEVTASSEENVLVSICIEGDETTKISDIVILDGNYSSLILILRWACCILRNTQMFLQFQLTTSITSILNTYLSTVTLPGTPGVDTRLVYVLVQLIWVNLGMGLIAAVTFGREKPQPSNYLMRKPLSQGRKWQLVTGFMWRNIMAQVVYQVLVISILQFQGSAIFGFSDEANDTVTFIMPMFLQVFNMINARKIEEKNIFSGIRTSFIWLVAILIAVPFVLVQILVHFVDFVGLDWKQWIICIGIAMVSWPVGFAVKFLPVRFLVYPFRAVLNKLKAPLRQLANQKFKVARL